MGSKDKAKKRNDKKFEALAAQFKAASSPTNPPARSPAVGPVRLTRILVPLETLPTGVWQQIAAFATTTTAATPSAVLKTVALVSRSCALAVEGGRHRQGQTPTQVVHAVLQKHAARGQPLPPTLQPLLAADSGAADLSATLAAVAACKDVAVIGRVAFAIVKLGRSVLHHVRRPDPPAAATEWLVSLVASGAMPLATHNVTTGRTLLHYAALFGDRSLASALITAAAKSPAGFDVFAVDSQRRTALHVAAGEGLADTCLCMIRYSDPARLDSLGTAQDASKRTVVDAATAASHSKLASTLREALHSVDDDDDGDYNDDEGYDDDY